MELYSCPFTVVTRFPSPLRMTPLHLPPDALKTILAFMNREQLVELTEVNRQFYTAIYSAPFTTKPLLRLNQLHIFPTVSEHRMKGYVSRSITLAGRYYDKRSVETILELQWVRIDR